MAKKKKQKKAGIAKRQKNKQQKKNAAKRKIQAMKTPQRRISPAKVKQNLKNLPSLIFEPELEGIAFSIDEVKQVTAEHEKAPDQIEAIATESFMQKVMEACQEMRIRFEQENDTDKNMMVHAILYFMEQEDAPAYLNQVVVAMFFRAQHQIKTPETPLELKELNLKLREYDETWSDYLQEKMDASGLTNILPGGQSLPTEPGSDAVEEAEETILLSSPFEAVIEEFGEYLTADLAMEEDDRERTVEDVEVLVNDYCEEKEITQLEDLKPRKVRNFLEGWFVRMMNPTRDDMEIMINSLALFFKFSIQKEKIPSETGEGIQKLFEDKSSLLASFDA